jgi:hypothetical protein
VTPGAPDKATAAAWGARVEDAVRLGVRFLTRVNLMDALDARRVRPTNRIGIGPTGLHEWAWLRFGLDLRDLLDAGGRTAPFWAMLARLSDLAKSEATAYAAELGLAAPLTVTTVKPAGTTAKIFVLTEGAHLSARRHFLRWVQFRGEREAGGDWRGDSDPLLAEYEARGYPVRTLSTFPGMGIVGFPTLSLFLRLGIGDRLVTAPEATPAEHFAWLRLLERHWIGAERGNQVSYTLKLRTDLHDLESFRSILLVQQPTVRGCAVLPVGPGGPAGHEYLPEEEVDEAGFRSILVGIRDPGLREAAEPAQIACAPEPGPR